MKLEGTNTVDKVDEMNQAMKGEEMQEHVLLTHELGKPLSKEDGEEDVEAKNEEEEEKHDCTRGRSTMSSGKW